MKEQTLYEVLNMKRKLKLYSWEYFKENHHINDNGRVCKYPNSKEDTYLTKEIVDVCIYDTQYSFPGPYGILVDESLSANTISQRERRVISWMIDEVMTEESHPEYFI